MPVATVPTYAEMWVHPAVVAALSEGVFVYTPMDPWDPAVTYEACAHVLAGDCPYGGCVYTAPQGAAAGIDPLDPTQTVWVRDDALLIDRLALFTATTSATWLLDTLTGNRLHGEECWAEDYQVNTCTIRLRQAPVAEVYSVVRIRRCNVVGEDIPDWCWKSQQTVSVCCGGCEFSHFACGCDDNVVRISYRIASNLPPGAEGLTAWLARQYGLAAAGQACSLPERVTTITRQGVSWTVLDPGDYRNQGQTGITRVDDWLATVRYSLGMGQLIDPLTSNRLFAKQLDCETAVPVVPVTSAEATVAFGEGDVLFALVPDGYTTDDLTRGLTLHLSWELGYGPIGVEPNQWAMGDVVTVTPQIPRGPVVGAGAWSTGIPYQDLNALVDAGGTVFARYVPDTPVWELGP
jgi:hypothetical protein